MKDLDCRFITADGYCHVNTCFLKKLKNECLEDRAEKIGLKDSYVMSDWYDDACDKVDGCGFRKRRKNDGAFSWKKDEALASSIAKKDVREIDDDLFQMMYVDQQKKWIGRKLKTMEKTLRECAEAIDRIGR